MVDQPHPPAPKGQNCPLYRRDMSKVCHKCNWWTHLRGTNPNSGQPVDEWGCAIAWLPMLLVENAQQARQAGAAIETFRNGVIEHVVETVAATLHEIAAVRMNGKIEHDQGHNR